MSIKAFKLVPAVEREMLMSDKVRITIECIECCGRNLYVGTNDGSICHFLLEEKNSPAEKTTFSVTKQLHKYLSFRKAVGELKAASALNRLLVLCDNTIMLMNMRNLEPIPTGARIKGAVTFTLNENPVSGDPFCVEVCIVSVKRRTIQLFLVYEDRVQIVKEVSTQEQPCAVAVDGHYLCLALTTQYIILNYNTGVSQDLFPYSSEERRPIVKRIGREEFLLAGPGGLGMFATVDGISQRAPVHWSENVIGAALCFPYVIALDEEFITVHSMLDQQQKQTLPFKDGHILQDFEGKVIVATTKGVYILVPLPLERQIQDLLASQRVEEALVLAKGARRNIPKEKFQPITTGGITYREQPWHKECFVCTGCKKQLSGQRFTSRDEFAYCLNCFCSLYAKKCAGCTNPISGLGGTKYISFEERQWHNDCFNCKKCSLSLVGRGFLTERDDILCPECGKDI